MSLDAAHAASGVAQFSFGRFGEATIYQPRNVRHVALFFSDAQGWSVKDAMLAQALADSGVLVAGVDTRHYAAQLAKPRKKCSYLAGEFEDFSHELQKRFSPARYHLPVLIGDVEGAQFAYAVAAQGSSGTFIGVLTLAFAPHWRPPLKLCQSYELRYAVDKAGVVRLKPSPQLSTPWIALQDDGNVQWPIEQLKKFVAAVGTARAVVASSRDELRWQAQVLDNVEKLAAPDRAPAVVAESLKDLPLFEVRAGKPSAKLALFLTGDGGWAEIDKSVSAELVKRGVDVVALSSLQYFWRPRSPDETAKDVARILRHYLAAWDKREVLIVGYSFGADVAPSVVNRLPAELRAAIVSVNLLGLAATADFEVHVTTWLGVDHHGVPVKPEVEKLSMPVLCVYGEGESDSLCAQLSGPNIKLAKVGSGHHFGDQYETLAKLIVGQ